MSQTFESKDIYAHMESINRINNPTPQSPLANFASPVKLTYAAPVQGMQSPQPNLSPSSLINYLYAQEQEGFSAPLVHNYKHTQSSASKSLSGSKEKPAAFGMFNWNWESSGDEEQENHSDLKAKEEE